MILDAQEYINELKTYKRYKTKCLEAKKRFREIERILLNFESSYVSPSAVTMVEVIRYRKGKKIKKLVPLPKLDPDPNRKNVIRSGLISEQCSLQKQIAYYERKIARIDATSKKIPEDLKELCFAVYVDKKAQEMADRMGYSLQGLYRSIKDDLEEFMKRS